MQGILPVTGKMPVPQVLLLKWKPYIAPKALIGVSPNSQSSGMGIVRLI
jgi:hypothetical protein